MPVSTPPTAPTAGVPTIVVVGHGMVGQRFLEALADRGLTPAAGTARVVVLCEEPRPAYDRVQLTSYFSGRTPEDLSLVEPGFMERHGIELRVGDPAESVDREARTVTARSGETFSYDTLVLATGSYPFVPPVPGKDAEGCFVYRTIEDLLAIEEYARNARTGAVVGGGLLGLEAAGALKGLGLDTHVVEFAPWLMPVQVDEGGGAALLRTIENMGLTVHTGVGTQEVTAGEDGRVDGMCLSDGSSLETDLVVFSAGVRPRDQLARDCGLAVGPRGGIVVDEECRTSDSAVFAIGECALASDGRVYGLVAPGYEMALAVAEVIAGNAASFTGADLSTKLKLLGVDVASFGDAHGAAEGCLDVVYADSRSGVYKKLVIGQDGTLLGGVLVGDADQYGTLRPMTGTVLPVAPEQLVLPAGAGGPVTLGPSSLPDDAVICSCHNVTKGAICEHTTLPEVKKCTKAGTGCGSCVKVIGQLLPQPADQGLCGCFEYTRSELYEIVRTLGVTTYAGLLDSHGREQARGGDGCEVCKPTVGSIIASLAPTVGASGYVLDGEQAALQDTNDHFLANLQRNGSYSVVPRIPGGEITPEKLIVIGEVARDFGLYTKITGGQRIDLFGARVDQLPLIWTRLVDAGFESGHAYGKSLRTVKSCVGQTWCRYGVQDSVKMAIDLSCATGDCVPAQAEVGGLRLRPGVRGGPRQGLRDHRHGAGLEPLRGRQRRRDAAPRGPARPGPVRRRTGPSHRPLPHVLHPHGGPSGAHLDLAGPDRGRPRPRPRRRRARLAGPLRRAGAADGRPRRRLPRRVGRDHRRPGAAEALRDLRERPRRTRPLGQVRPRAGPGQARPRHPRGPGARHPHA